MALIEQYHVVADMFPIDLSGTNNPDIVEGMHVMLNSSGNAIKATGGSATYCIGVAGDSSEETTGNTPYAADLIINSSGTTRSTSNRVSDFYNETASSNKITVYQGGGKFSTDQYVTAQELTIAAGDPLFTSAGLLTETPATNGQVVGICTIAPSAYPSGVPGTQVDGSMSLGSYLTFIQVNTQAALA